MSNNQIKIKLKLFRLLHDLFKYWIKQRNQKALPRHNHKGKSLFNRLADDNGKTLLRYLISLVTAVLLGNNALAALPIAPCHSICAATDKKPLPPGAYCSLVDNQLMYYRLFGNGKITFIFSSGTGYPADVWYQSGLVNEAAKLGRVLIYDRLYTFNSCPNRNNYLPNSALDVVHRLHRLLAQQHIKPPYILVGHSFGGLYMLLYAKLYPQQVAGLLLMDPSSAAGPTPLPTAALPILRQMGNPQNPSPVDPLYNEKIGQLPSYLQTQYAPALQPTIPLIVMYATKHCLPTGMTKSDKLYCMTKQQEHNHLIQQQKIYNMSDIHQLVRIEGGHNSFFNQKNRPQTFAALHNIVKLSQLRSNQLISNYQISNQQTEN